MMTEIVFARRTPIGRFMGGLSRLPAPALLQPLIAAARQELPLVPEKVDELLVGQVLTAGSGQAPARQAGRGGGLPDHVPATTINKVCGSSLQTVMLADRAIRSGDAQVVLAGGQENMSLAPHLLPAARKGVRFGATQLLDHMQHDGLCDAYDGSAMGNYGELCAAQYHFARTEQDAYALHSYQRARTCWENGHFTREVLPIEVAPDKMMELGSGKERAQRGGKESSRAERAQRGGKESSRAERAQRGGKESSRAERAQRGGKESSRAERAQRVTQDEEPFAIDLDRLPSLRPAFKKDGTITAGNASSISDGAALLVLAAPNALPEVKPMARIIAQAKHAQAPEWFTTAPVEAIRKVCAQAKMKVNDIDLFEINEAFAVVPMAAMRELELDHAKVNVCGGAVALGHPIGASGSRVLVTLLHALAAHDLRLGLATLCIGGGEACAVIVERLT